MSHHELRHAAFSPVACTLSKPRLCMGLWTARLHNNVSLNNVAREIPYTLLELPTTLLELFIRYVYMREGLLNVINEKR